MSDRGPTAAVPEDLASLLAERNAGDLDGVVDLYEPGAVLSLPDGALAEGHEAIRRFYAALLATKPVFAPGEQAASRSMAGFFFRVRRAG